MKVRTQIKSYLFILPSFILICTFFYYPVLYAITSSFTDLRLGGKASFVGFDNYIRLFGDPIFIKGLINQLILTGADVIKNLSFPFIAAEILFFIKRKSLAFKFKTLFVVPMLVPGMVVMMLWICMYNNFGAINSLLDSFGIGYLKHDWLGDQGTALISIIGIGFPFVSGLYFLIFHAGLGTISGEVEEAAVIDGCTSFGLVRFIHIPNLVPYFSVVFILTVIGSLQDYVKILVTTRGGPGGYTTYVPALQMYHTAFDSYQMGYASSIGITLFALIILLTVASMKLTKADKN